ncbi:MAG: YbjN domain-containing protein [Gemmatales bacterium]
MSLLESAIDSGTDPLQVVEDVASVHDWSFERSGIDEVTILVKGKWTDYQVSFTWMPEIEALHLACTFDMKIPDARKTEAQRLVALINEQLWIGHFDRWSQSGLVMYRTSAGADGRPRGHRSAMRGHADQRHRRLRALLPSLPVRRMGRQIGARGDGRGDVRHLRRGVTGAPKAL